MISVAGWQSGYAAACKAVHAGSIPASASNTFIEMLSLHCHTKMLFCLLYNLRKS